MPDARNTSDGGKSPSEIDRLVGSKVRWRRRELKLTQEALGKKLNITFQQMQKYERGVNRISAGRLYEIAQQLGVDMSYFYEGADAVYRSNSNYKGVSAGPAPTYDGDEMEFLAAFQSIEDKQLRKDLIRLIKTTVKLVDPSN